MSRTELYTQVLTHTHSRSEYFLEKDILTNDSTRNDSSFTIDGLTKLISGFQNGREFIFVDNDHPVNILDRYGLDRKESYVNIKSDPEIKKTIDAGLIERSIILKEKYPNFFSGVEANILNSNGDLDVSDEALSELDYVIASLHWSYWKLSNGTDPNLEDYLKSLINLSKNKNVDSIGHPIRELQKNNLFNLKGWDNALEALSSAGIAYEINLNYLFESGLSENELKVVNLAVKKGMKFIIGFDFHNLNILGYKFPENEIIDLESVENILSRIKGAEVKFLLKKYLYIIKALKKIGVIDQNIINSNVEKFNNWLMLR